jgi:hypothetical protein
MNRLFAEGVFDRPGTFSAVGLSIFAEFKVVPFPKDMLDYAFQIFVSDGGIEAMALRVSTTQSAQSASSR